jgi:arylsulfatase A-like enzyme
MTNDKHLMWGWLVLCCLVAWVATSDVVSAQEVAESFQCPECNVIVVSMTNLRADHMGIYGYGRDTTPHLDQFGAQAILFKNAFSVASWTLPVAMSLFTSQYPLTHQVMTRTPPDPAFAGVMKTSLPESSPTLVDLLHQYGYHSASMNSGMDYVPSRGLTNRFEHVRSFMFDAQRVWGEYGSYYNVIPAAIAWLQEHHKKKFFLHIQGYDVHCPFAYPFKNARFDGDYPGRLDDTQCYWTFEKAAPITVKTAKGLRKVYSVKTSANELKKEPVRSEQWIKQQNRGIINDSGQGLWRIGPRDIEHMIALYDGEIYNSDQLLGQLLESVKRLGLMNNTIIIFLSEHGDMFGKHGRFMRGGPLRGTFYEDVLHVPLIIYHPHVKARQINSLVSLVDIFPTILDFLGIAIPEGLKGKSLMPTLEGNPIRDRVFAGAVFTPEPNNTLFSYSTMVTSVREEEWKLIQEILVRNSGVERYWELYNLKNDPQELDNVALNFPEKLKTLQGDLSRWLREELGVDENIMINILMKGKK